MKKIDERRNFLKTIGAFTIGASLPEQKILGDKFDEYKNTEAYHKDIIQPVSGILTTGTWYPSDFCGSGNYNIPITFDK